MEQFSNDGRPRRREYSKPFKPQVIAQCGQPGASVGGVALSGSGIRTSPSIQVRRQPCPSKGS